MIGIVAAYRHEIRDYLRGGRFRVLSESDSLRFYQSPSMHRVVVVCGAIGKERAQRAAAQLIEGYRPALIVSAGFAGAAQEGVRTGDLFVCDRVMSVEGPMECWRPDAARERRIANAVGLERLGIAETGPRREFAYGGCLSVPALVSSGAAKAWIGSAFAVSVIDMESYWVSEAAGARGAPCLVVRSVLDTVGQTLPAFVGQAVDGGDERVLGRALRHIAARPTKLPELVRLAAQARVARRSLGSFLVRLSQARAAIAV